MVKGMVDSWCATMGAAPPCAAGPGVQASPALTRRAGGASSAVRTLDRGARAPRGSQPLRRLPDDRGGAQVALVLAHVGGLVEEVLGVVLVAEGDLGVADVDQHAGAGLVVLQLGVDRQ